MLGRSGRDEAAAAGRGGAAGRPDELGVGDSTGRGRGRFFRMFIGVEVGGGTDKSPRRGRGSTMGGGWLGQHRDKVGKLGVAALIALAIALLISGVNGNRSTPEAAALPPGVEQVGPASLATNVPGQSTVFADLAFGNTGVLVVQGREIPLDQLDYVRATGMLSFTPGDDKEFKRLPGDVVRVVAIFWPEQGDRATDAREYAWSFKVS